MNEREFYTFTSAICRTQNPVEVKTVLCQRTVPQADVWSFETKEEADIFAVQHSSYIGYRDPDSQGSVCLPAGSSYAIRNPAVNSTIPMSRETEGVYAMNAMAMKAFYVGFWCIDAINGYAVTSDIDQLMWALVDSQFLYVHAVWLDGSPVESAINIARSRYIRRFYTRYNGQNERLTLPQDPRCMIYLDPYFADRERRYCRNSAMETLQTYGLF